MCVYVRLPQYVYVLCFVFFISGGGLEFCCFGVCCFGGLLLAAVLGFSRCFFVGGVGGCLWVRG